MSASTNFNFPSHPTSRSHAVQIVEGTRALEQSPLAASKYTSSSPNKKTNYAESTTSISSFSSRTGLLKEKFRSSFGSTSSPSSDSKRSNKSVSHLSPTSSQSGKSNKTSRTKQNSLLLLGSQIRMGH